MMLFQQASKFRQQFRTVPDQLAREITVISSRPHLKPIIPTFMRYPSMLQPIFRRLDICPSYVQDQFIQWLANYASYNDEKTISPLHLYLMGDLDINSLCKDFTKFCFAWGISLDKDKTLQSFEPQAHLFLSDSIKKGLEKFRPQNTFNILGFGLGNGNLEKGMARCMMNYDLARTVKIYGIDHDEKGDGIEYLPCSQLTAGQAPHFDLITTRKTLHHANLEKDWPQFVDFINTASQTSQANTQLLVVEHGLIPSHISPFNQGIYYLLNAFFDVIVNIGIRPYWVQTGNFHVEYLNPKDFSAIKNGDGDKVQIQTVQDQNILGPCCFPHPTTNVDRTPKSSL